MHVIELYVQYRYQEEKELLPLYSINLLSQYVSEFVDGMAWPGPASRSNKIAFILKSIPF
jgi:hypothetical protein